MSEKQAVINAIQSKIKTTAILVKFKVASNEIAFSELNPPLYLRVSLHTYLWYLQPIIDDFFFEHKAKFEDRQIQFWLSVDDEPLNFSWHFGTVLDVYFSDKTIEIPEVTVHYKNYPATLPKYDGATSIEEIVMHNLKEIVALRTGRRELIRMNLMPEEKSMIFKALQEQNFTQIDTILKPFRGFYKVPKVKVQLLLKNARVWVARNADAGATLKQFLADSFPSLFDSETKELATEFTKLRVFCCGIQLNFDAKIDILEEAFSYFDLVLKLVLDY